MNKINLSIDLLKLQGAKRMMSKSGRDIVVIDLAESRARPHQNGAVYFELDVVENKNGADQYGKTHWITEPVTKSEREQGIKYPIIGNGKEYRDGGQRANTSSQSPPPAPRYKSSLGPMPEDDGGEVPF